MIKDLFETDLSSETSFCQKIWVGRNLTANNLNLQS